MDCFQDQWVYPTRKEPADQGILKKEDCEKDFEKREMKPPDTNCCFFYESIL